MNTVIDARASGRIKSIPTVKELIETIMKEAEGIIRKMPKFLSGV